MKQASPNPATSSRPRPWLRVGAGFALVLLLVAPGWQLFFPSIRPLDYLPGAKREKFVLSGGKASGTVIDGAGGWFNEGRLTEIVIRSDKAGPGWDRPEGITIRNLRLRGSIRIMGMGENGQGEFVRASSRSPGHTERAQAAAPSRIVISNVTIESDRRIPVYLAPGVTNVTIENCRFTGWSVSTAIYLDAESADNRIVGNTFDLRCHREVIAVDGSARNHIEGNAFEQPWQGGIYLYRNSGEGGTVRHQCPQQNVLSGNRFRTGSLAWRAHLIWLGSRGGRWRPYAEDDKGFPFGSSADNHDFADRNTVSGNTFTPPHPCAISDEGKENRVETRPPVDHFDP